MDITKWKVSFCVIIDSDVQVTSGESRKKCDGPRIILFRNTFCEYWIIFSDVNLSSWFHWNYKRSVFYASLTDRPYDRNSKQLVTFDSVISLVLILEYEFYCEIDRANKGIGILSK